MIAPVQAGAMVTAAQNAPSSSAAGLRETATVPSVTTTVTATLAGSSARDVRFGPYSTAA